VKFILLAICLISSAAYAQHATFKEIRLKANPRFNNDGDTSIVYPVVVTNNPGVNKLINDKIIEELMSQDDKKASLRKDLADMINNGTTDLSYEVTFNRSNILSLNIYMEGCGAHCSSSYLYFNFDLKTGKSLAITDLIEANKLDSLRKIVFSDKIGFLKEYKKERKEALASKEIDSDLYDSDMQEVDSNCMDSAELENFSLSKDHMKIIDPCEFPHMIEGQAPVYELKYTYKILRGWMKPKFKALL
jgi:hypothetical protein